MSFKPDKICAKKFAIFRTLFSGRPRLKVKVSKSTFASRWPPRFLSEHFRPTESVRESSQLSPTEKLQKKKCPICGKCEESEMYALSGLANQDASWPSNRKLTAAHKNGRKWSGKLKTLDFSKSWPALPMMVRCGLAGWFQYDHPPPRMVKDEFPKEIKTDGLCGGETFA